MDLAKQNLEFELLCDEFSRIKTQAAEMKKIMNLTDADIADSINDLKTGNVPKELEESILQATAAAKEAGNARAAKAKPATGTGGGAGRTARRQGVVRLN